MHSDWFNGIEILQGRWQHGEKVGYCYPCGLVKTLCKWNIYVLLVKKWLKHMKKGSGSNPCPVSCNVYVDKYKMKKLPTLLHFGKSTNIKLVIHNLTCRLVVNTLALHL